MQPRICLLKQKNQTDRRSLIIYIKAPDASVAGNKRAHQLLLVSKNLILGDLMQQWFTVTWKQVSFPHWTLDSNPCILSSKRMI